MFGLHLTLRVSILVRQQNRETLCRFSSDFPRAMDRLVPFGALLVAVATTACGGEHAAEARSSARDSLGITIIRHSAAAVDDVWLQLGAPALEIGSVDGEAPYLFSDVRDGYRFADGRLLVIDRRTQELRYFGADGRHIRTSGGDGDGPGELRSLLSLIATDSLIGVVDITRTSWFDADGDYVRSDPIDLSAMRRLASGPLLIALPRPLPGGAWFSLGENPPAPQADGLPLQTFALWFPPSLERIDTLAEHPTGLLWETPRGSFAMAPFWPRMLAATGGPDGTIYVSSNDVFEISQFDALGKLRRIIRFDAAPLPVREKDIEEWKAARRARAAGTPREATVERELAQIPLPEVFPPFREFRVDRLGRLWAERWPREDEEHRFLVVGVRGESLGNVVVPPGFGIIDAGADHILGVQRDELDVPYVQLFHIR